MNTWFMEMKKLAPCSVLTPEFGIQLSWWLCKIMQVGFMHRIPPGSHRIRKLCSETRQLCAAGHSSWAQMCFCLAFVPIWFKRFRRQSTPCEYINNGFFLNCRPLRVRANRLHARMEGPVSSFTRSIIHTSARVHLEFLDPTARRVSTCSPVFVLLKTEWLLEYFVCDGYFEYL